MDALIAAAAEAVASADHVLITAGAGIGVDSGLPDFRGDEGFWKAYPPYRKLGVGFVGMANPAGFERDPPFAWGFYGHRLNLYRATVPHVGFAILKRWAEAKKSAFVLTSNVDGQFQRAGFADPMVCEIHGSIHHLQCAAICHESIWSAEGTSVEVDMETMRAVGDLPTCPRCGGVARPNILMFGDFVFLSDRVAAQEKRFRRWSNGLRGGKLVVVEAGAGTALPSIRHASQRQLRARGATLVRINPTDPQGPSGTIGLAMGAADALSAIDAVAFPAQGVDHVAGR